MGLKTRCHEVASAIVLLMLLHSSHVGAASKKWAHPFTPLREFYISPTGAGAGSASNPMSLSSAINSAFPGDLYWLKGGTYNGLLSLFRHGTSAHPIVFRAVPGDHVVIHGSVDILGAYNWIWGFDITDPGGTTAGDSGVRLLAAGAHVINNVIHHHTTKNGIGAWQNGPGHVVYGNTVFANGHNIYMQNDFTAHGYKYIVGNMLLDSANQCSGCFNVHGYTQNDMVTGFFLQQNIISNGKFLLGGYNIPADREVVKKNYFYSARTHLGWRRPSQAKFRKNYMVRSLLVLQWFWGDGEVLYNQTKPNEFTKNELYLPQDGIHHIYFVTSAYLAEGRCEGCPAIRASDTFNNNKYSTPFQATFFANNSNLGSVNMSEWRSATGQAGNSFDVNSSEVPVPTTNKVVVVRNEYEAGRAHIAIFNWEAASDVTVNLSSFVANGSSIKILDPLDAFGTPIYSGTYNGPVTIPTGGAEFKAFLVQTQ